VWGQIFFFFNGQDQWQSKIVSGVTAGNISACKSLLVCVIDSMHRLAPATLVGFSVIVITNARVGI
jgi:hypothetical protein